MKTLVRNGLVVDGSGASSFKGSVLVEDDRIAAVLHDGEAIGEVAADEVIDAAGELITPGFIDSHAHSDAYLILEPDAPSKITQGITTEINGQCGGSIAPRYGEARLSSDWALLLGDRLSWRSLAEYREVFDAVRPAVNSVQFIGHNTLRASVVGYAPRPATADEMKTMSRLLESALDDGGWGLSTGLIYQPGKYSTSDEVTALAKVAALKGGYYATHMRSEGDAIVESIDEVLALVKATGIRAEISHLKTSGRRNWSKLEAVIKKLDAAIGDGLLLGSDRYPYCAAGTDLDIVLPDWMQQGGCPAEVERLKTPGVRERLLGELEAMDRDWSEVMIGGTWHPDNRHYSGRLITDILAQGDTSAATPGALVLEILERDGFKTGGFFFSMSDDNLAQIYSRPWIVPGSDASLRAPWGPLAADHPHPRAYATMPESYRQVRALGFSLEATVARMTSVPCERFGIRQRGRLVRGAYADLVVWSEQDFRGRSTFAEPHQFSEGVRLVMVNGKVSYRDGKFTQSRGGRMLER